MIGLPGGWSAAPVRNLGELRLGKMLDRAKNHGVPARYLRNINVRWKRFDLEDLYSLHVSPEEMQAISVEDGDLFICEGGEPGRCAVWRSGKNDLVYQKALHRFRTNGSMIPELLMYWLMHDAAAGTLADAFTGTTIKHLTGESLGRYMVPVPPLAEQRRIADKLDNLLACVDACRDRLDRVTGILKRFRQAVLAAATSGELTRGWRDEHGSTLEDWTYMRAADACAAVQSGGTPKEGFVDTPGVPFLKVYNIVDQRIAFTERPQYVATEIHKGPLKKSQTQPGDVLMNIVGPPLGKVAIVPSDHPAWNINQAIALFRPSQHVDTEWLYILLCSGINIRSIVHETRGSAGQINISLSQCRDFQFPLPPEEERLEIVRRVQQLLTGIDTLERRLACAKTAVYQLGPHVLSMAFRGDLVPQDPNDEPASVLLERIRAEKSQVVASKAKRGRKPKVLTEA